MYSNIDYFGIYSNEFLLFLYFFQMVYDEGESMSNE